MTTESSVFLSEVTTTHRETRAFGGMGRGCLLPGQQACGRSANTALPGPGHTRALCCQVACTPSQAG